VVVVTETVFGGIYGSGPPEHPPAPSTVYVVYQPGFAESGKFAPSTIIPIRTATNTPAKPIRIRGLSDVAITPDGKTIYAVTGDGIVPISVATGKPGKPIRADGTSLLPSDTIIPINLATHAVGKPINLSSPVSAIEFTPDGRTAYAPQIRIQGQHSHSDQHRHRHARPADPHRLLLGFYGDHAQREDGLCRHCRRS
jgi:hypothetical protein